MKRIEESGTESGFLPDIAAILFLSIAISSFAVAQSAPSANQVSGQAPAAQTPAPAAKPGHDVPLPTPKPEELTRAGDSIRVSVNAPRPLERALDQLRAKFAWPVSYEDPRYLPGKDIAPAPGDSDAWLPAGGAFAAEIPAGGADTPDRDKSLEALIAAYNKTENPGKFELRKTADEVAVVGVGTRDEAGKMVSQTPLLDTSITIPVQERTIADTLTQICQTLADAVHNPVSLGVTPRSLVDYTNVSAGGAQKPARDILAQALAASKAPVYWRLLFDPTTKGYFLNIHSIRVSKATAAPKKN